MKKNYPLIIIFLLIAAVFYQSNILKLNVTSAQRVSDAESRVSFYEELLKSFKAKDFQGNTISYDSITKPVILINFWASWCAPCLKELPSLVELKKKFSSKVEVITVNQDQEEKIRKINEVKAKYNADFIYVADEEQKIVDLFKVKSLPFTLIYSAGKIIHLSREEEDFLAPSLIQKIENSLKD